MKGYERELESTQRVMEAMAEHNKQLADSLDRLQVSQATHNMPDPSADPAGYHNFLMDTMGNLIKKHMAPPPEFKARPLPDDADTPVPTSPQDNVAHNRFVAQEIAMQSIHDDYDTVVAEVNKIIQVDPAVSHRIYSSTNPPKEAYRVGREILSAKEKQVSDRRSQGYVESSGLSPAPSQDNDHKLTADEKKVAAMLGISPEKYAKQKNAIAKAKTGR